jgi:hypothetical protein
MSKFLRSFAFVVICYATFLVGARSQTTSVIPANLAASHIGEYMTVKSQTFEDRIAQAVEFPFFPFAFPTNYYAVCREPYKFSFAQQPGHESVAGLELGYLFRAHAAFRPTYPIYPLSGDGGCGLGKPWGIGRMPFSMLSSSGMGSANLTANRTSRTA